MEIVTHVSRLFFFAKNWSVVGRSIWAGSQPSSQKLSYLRHSGFRDSTDWSPPPPCPWQEEREDGEECHQRCSERNQDLQKQNVADWHHHNMQRNKNMHHCRIPGDLSSCPSHNLEIKWSFNVLLQSVTCSMCAFMFLSVSFFGHSITSVTNLFYCLS